MATRRTRTHTYTIPHVLRMLSYVSVLLLGLAIALGVVLGWFPGVAQVGGWIKNIALLIGVIVLCWYSYYDAVTRSRAWFIVWIIAVVLVVVFYILGLAPISFK